MPTRRVFAGVARPRALGGAGLVALLLGFGSLSSFGAQAQTSPSASPGVCSSVRIVLSNPSPGDLLTPGSYVVQGTAVDTAATSAPGVDRVQVFFDQSRDNGGHLIGEVDAGQSSPDQSLSSTGFKLVALIPDTAAENNTHAVYVYARSAVTGQEQVLSLQVQLKQPLSVGPLTPTPTPPPVGLATPPCSGPTPTPTFPPFPRSLAGTSATPGANASPGANATPGTTDTLTLQVGNPQPGDTIGSGTYVIDGVAFDAAATSGTGIEHVQVFLDPRDQGGLFLGQATLGTATAGGVFGFQLVAQLPNRAGGHTLSVYALSAVSGREAAVSIPITIN